MMTLQKSGLHPWLRKVKCAYVPGPHSPMLEDVVAGILTHFDQFGHEVEERANDETDVILTTAKLGEPMRWRDALLFSARRRLNISRTPTIYTVVHARPAEFESLLAHFENALQKPVWDPGDYDFPGLAPTAGQVLHEQGERGGPILAVQRLIQAQSKSIRVILVVGEDAPQFAYHFDLVGAYPTSQAETPAGFYTDIVLRIVTTLSSREVTNHQVVDTPIPAAQWAALKTPAQMCHASHELGRRNFFTDTVRIFDLVEVPAISDAVSNQYSEGCFGTWDPHLEILIVTVTGSARPVEKGNLSDADLAVIVGVRADGMGALVRHVEGKQNDPPSSEAVEMMAMDDGLPRIMLDPVWKDWAGYEVPVIRSKLHGHRGIGAYDPLCVEYIPLETPYYHYLVSCATHTQSEAIQRAFTRSEALLKPHDPRQVAFTVLPGHGAMIVEKWVPGMQPFQLIWEYMDAGRLQIANRIPQGPMWYMPDATGRMVVKTVEPDPDMTPTPTGLMD